jgi:uncharacterized phage protein (TIGR01671 family)
MFNENRFKFRIYDKETKEMFYFKLGEKLFSPNFDTYFEQNPQKILMQCTGLTDKNGELIYEGDIVKDTKFMYVVSWKSQVFSGVNSHLKKLAYTGFVAKLPNMRVSNMKVFSGISQSFDCNTDFFFNQEGKYADDFIIIGNIYQNPNLIT